jgi:hypothetical protein
MLESTALLRLGAQAASDYRPMACVPQKYVIAFSGHSGRGRLPSRSFLRSQESLTVSDQKS